MTSCETHDGVGTVSDTGPITYVYCGLGLLSFYKPRKFGCACGVNTVFWICPAASVKTGNVPNAADG